MPAFKTTTIAAVLLAFAAAFFLRPAQPTVMSIVPPTDRYAQMQYMMRNTHELYKTAYKQILPHLDNPPLDDLFNFLFYVRAWASSIVGHHDSEEAVLFPFLNTKLDFSHEMEQHVPIAAGLDAIIKFIDVSQGLPERFDAKKFKQLVVGLGDALFEHMDEEVEDLAPEKLKVFTEEELKHAGEVLMVWIRAHSDKYVTLPFMRCHTPPELKEVWPPFPWILKRVVIPWFLAPKHAEAWKYAPYEMV
ncbi:hypothetical protein MKEN_00436000 [Mycena kentingensis (nom. inval.)]|nr:hypothetical protein MKEN_00436000 [Mycena kentingensis (nom. inval.)]